MHLIELNSIKGVFMISKLIEKAEILIEALPYIKFFYKKTFVIKYGGAAMNSEEIKKSLIEDIILLKYIGINPVIVHGGGPMITNFLNKMGVKSKFVNGLRVTDEETMKVVQMVLIGIINKEIVNSLNLHGGNAVGLSGIDANLIIATKKIPELIYNNNEKKTESIDLGYVGEIKKINAEIINSLTEQGYIPVIAPIGIDLDGICYNINADEAASEIAVAIKAEKLIMLSDVDGIYEIPEQKNTKIDVISYEKAMQMIQNNQITGGMIPKVKACLDATAGGVKKAHIIDGNKKHALLLEIFTDKGIGTMIVKD